MTGDEIRAARVENGSKPMREPQRRLMQAYLNGYWPDDWPL